MTQPGSLYTCAGGVLEESSDGNKTQHQMLQQIELQHRKDGAVEKGKGRTWVSPRASARTASLCQRQCGIRPTWGCLCINQRLLGVGPGHQPPSRPTQGRLWVVPAREFFARGRCCAPRQLLFTLNKLFSFPCG